MTQSGGHTADSVPLLSLVACAGASSTGRWKATRGAICGMTGASRPDQASCLSLPYTKRARALVPPVPASRYARPCLAGGFWRPRPPRGTKGVPCSQALSLSASRTRGALRTSPPAAARRREHTPIGPRCAAQDTSADGPARKYRAINRTSRCTTAALRTPSCRSHPSAGTGGSSPSEPRMPAAARRRGPSVPCSLSRSCRASMRRVDWKKPQAWACRPQYICK